MTGKEQRVMHGYESLSQISKLAKNGDVGAGFKPKNFDVPELGHNVDMLLDMTEERILQTDKKLKYYEDSIVSLEYDEKKAKDRLNNEKNQLKRLNELLRNVER